ncbi:MAG TPA: hypothetical protein ENN80_08105, partial [Candidatus Hydrogenedentes bacterium]|nr:hypothetical protein [Candidatus Hydrogenedentota bacterium]
SAVGTPAYMPPEQAQGQLTEVDERSDVYSLGAVLYELLTGHAPFEGGTVYSTLWRVLTEAPPSVTSLEPNAPPELVAICQRAMHKDRNVRYASAKELAEEIGRFLSGALVQTYEYNFKELVARFIRRHKAVLATVAVAACILLVGGVLSYLRVVEERDRAVAAREEEARARQAEESARRKAEWALAEAEQAREAEHQAREVAERESYSSSVLLAQENIDDGLFNLARQALWGTPEHQRDWEWGYLLQQCNQSLYTFAGHCDRIVDLALSPDGRLFATASWDYTVIVWDAYTGGLVATLEGHEDGVIQACFDGEGQRVVTASFDGTARVWDARTGEQLAVLKGHDGAVNMATFSPDGRRIGTASPDKTARLWDAQTGEQLASVPEQNNNVGSVWFSPDGTQILTVAWQGPAIIWDIENQHEIASLDGPSIRCYKAIYDPSGTRVLTIFLDEAADTVSIWDAYSGVVLVTLAGHSDRIVDARYSADGARVVTASSDKTAMVWDA